MRIAIPTDDGRTVADHFGRTEYFTIVEIEDGKEISRKLYENLHAKGHGHHGDITNITNTSMHTDTTTATVITMNVKMDTNMGTDTVMGIHMVTMKSLLQQVIFRQL